MRIDPPLPYTYAISPPPTLGRLRRRTPPLVAIGRFIRPVTVEYLVVAVVVAVRWPSEIKRHPISPFLGVTVS